MRIYTTEHYTSKNIIHNTNTYPGLPPLILSNNASIRHDIEIKNTDNATPNGNEHIFSVKRREWGLTVVAEMSLRDHLV